MRIKLIHVNGFDDDLVFSNKPMDDPIEEFEFPDDSLPTETTNTNFTTSSITLRQPTLVFPSRSTNFVNNSGTPAPGPTTNAVDTSKSSPFVFSGGVNSETSNLSSNPFRVRARRRNVNNNADSSTLQRLSACSVPAVHSVYVNSNFSAQEVVTPATLSSGTIPAIVTTFNAIQPVLETITRKRNHLDCQIMNNSSYTTQTINISTTETINTTSYVRHQNEVENGKVQKINKNGSPHLLNRKTKAQKKKILELLDEIPMKAIRKFAWTYNNFYY